MFPRSLAPWQKLIEATAVPTVLLSLKRETTPLYRSKIGGVPFFPAKHPPDVVYVPYPGTSNVTPWPKHRRSGRELMLLLQLDFGAMPPLPSFPKEGILQLFVDDTDWHDLGAELRAIYHRRVVRKPELLFSDFDHDPGVHRVAEYALSFTKEEEYMTNSDFRFDRDLYSALARDDGAWKAYLKLTDHRHSGHAEVGYGRTKIGGYHYSQNGQDPRASRPGWQDSLLLAQFQNYGDLSWGDGGSAQFFIKRKDLERCKFDDLLFHWDST